MQIRWHLIFLLLQYKCHNVSTNHHFLSKTIDFFPPSFLPCKWICTCTVLSYPIRVSAAREGVQSAYGSALNVSWANVAQYVTWQNQGTKVAIADFYSLANSLYHQKVSKETNLRFLELHVGELFSLGPTFLLQASLK